MPGKYAQLIAQFPLRPIRTDRQLRRASDVAWQLAVQARLSRDEQDYLDVLSDLISAYEARRHPIDTNVPPREMLQFLIDEHALSLTQLAEETGIRISTLSEVLRGKRGLNIQHVARLAERFHVSPAVFIERPILAASA